MYQFLIYLYGLKPDHVKELYLNFFSSHVKQKEEPLISRLALQRIWQGIVGN